MKSCDFMRSYIEIDNIKVSQRIFTAKFCCDYGKCGGACCNKPADFEVVGCYLSDYEAADILHNRKKLMELCDEEDRKIVSENPVEKIGKHFYTALNNKKCVFSCMGAKTCALKTAKEKGLADTGVPASCSLYPIVYEDHGDYEQLTIGDWFDDYCRFGYEKGERENTYMLDFLKSPIIDTLGEDFYDKLKNEQTEYIGNAK